MIGLKVPPLMVFPSNGDLYLRCGNCGKQEFKVHVRPQHQAAMVKVIECARCKKIFKVDDESYLEGTGKIDSVENNKKALV